MPDNKAHPTRSKISVTGILSELFSFNGAFHGSINFLYELNVSINPASQPVNVRQ